MQRSVGTFEYQILSVLLQQRGHEAYGLSILKAIADLTGREPSLGAIYTTLDRMEKKGFVVSRWGEATPERGGRRKRLYDLQASGIEVLRRDDATREKFSGHLPVGGALA